MTVRLESEKKRERKRVNKSVPMDLPLEHDVAHCGGNQSVSKETRKGTSVPRSWICFLAIFFSWALILTYCSNIVIVFKMSQIIFKSMLSSHGRIYCHRAASSSPSSSMTRSYNMLKRWKSDSHASHQNAYESAIHFENDRPEDVNDSFCLWCHEWMDGLIILVHWVYLLGSAL